MLLPAVSQQSVCVCFTRLLRGRRAGGLPRGSQSEGGEHGRRGADGDGGPAVWDEGEGPDHDHDFLAHF